MKSADTLKEIKRNYSDWSEDFETHLENVKNWEKEIIQMRRDLDGMRMAINRHAKLIDKHKELLNSNKSHIHKKKRRLNSTDENLADKLSLAHENEKEQIRFQKIAHDSIRKSHTKLLASVNSITRHLK